MLTYSILLTIDWQIYIYVIFYIIVAAVLKLRPLPHGQQSPGTQLAHHRTKQTTEPPTKHQNEWRALWGGDHLNTTDLWEGREVYLALTIIIFSIILFF